MLYGFIKSGKSMQIARPTRCGENIFKSVSCGRNLNFKSLCRKANLRENWGGGRDLNSREITGSTFRWATSQRRVATLQFIPNPSSNGKILFTLQFQHIVFTSHGTNMTVLLKFHFVKWQCVGILLVWEWEWKYVVIYSRCFSESSVKALRGSSVEVLRGGKWSCKKHEVPPAGISCWVSACNQPQPTRLKSS